MIFFFFNDTATTEIYTLSLHDALPIWHSPRPDAAFRGHGRPEEDKRHLRARSRLERDSHPRRYIEIERAERGCGDRKSTRLNSSHANISYAVFCLKKKKHN